MSKDGILLPIFEECKKYTLDPFWKDILTSCSKNKFPKGMKYNPIDNILYVKDKNNKSTSFQLSSDVKSIFRTVIDIFKKEFGIYSPLDIQQKRKEIGDLQEENDASQEWKTLKPRILKDFFILEFVKKLSKQHNLSGEEKKKLYDEIQFSIHFNKITAAHINFNVGTQMIESIEGLVFDKKTRQFNVTNESNIPHKSEKNTVDKRVYQAIDKFIREKRAQQEELS
jgi:hypothetical protein